MTSRSVNRTTIVGVLAWAFMLAGGRTACAQDLPKVSTARPVRKAIHQKTEQPGRIEALLTAPLHAKVSGYVSQVLVDIGDRVKGPIFDPAGKETSPGQPLLTIAAPELEEQVNQATAKIKQAESDIAQADAAVLVAKAILKSAESRIQEARALVLKSDANVKRWTSENTRVIALVKSNSVTMKVADETEQQLRGAEADQVASTAAVSTAEAKVAEARAGIAKAEADVIAAKARLAVAEAEKRQAAAVAGYLVIRAPFDGVVSQRAVDPGRLVQSPTAMASPLLTVVKADIVRLFVEVPESDAVLVEPGRTATVRIPALPDQKFTAKVTRTAWSLESSNRSLKTELDMPNPDQQFRPGMFAQVELTVAEKSDALVIPRTAVVTSATGPICFAVGKDGTIEGKPVRLGLRTGTEVEVISGVSADDELISANVGAFKPGQRVTTASK